MWLELYFESLCSHVHHLLLNALSFAPLLVNVIDYLRSVIAPSLLENVLKMALALYMNGGGLDCPLPTCEEVLVCNQATTIEEVSNRSSRLATFSRFRSVLIPKPLPDFISQPWRKKRQKQTSVCIKASIIQEAQSQG